MNHPVNNVADRSRVTKDSLFVVQESRELFLRRLREIARQAGIVSPPVAEAFQQALGETYDALVEAKCNGFEQTHGLTSSHITLMSDHDVELGIHIGKLTQRLNDICGEALWRVQDRYMALLRRPEMRQTDNPVGLEVIVVGLRAICRSSGSSLEDDLILLDSIGEQLVLELPDLYRELNGLLGGLKIAPEAKRINSADGVQKALGVQSAANVEGGPGPLSDLYKLLARQRVGAQSKFVGLSPDNVAVNAAGLVFLNQVAAQLDQLKAYSAGKDFTAAMPEGSEKTMRTFSAKAIGLPSGNPEAVALDTLALIFEAIFATEELPGTIKLVINRLQIPLLKLAIFDHSLFEDVEHPARRLINNVARAAVGLPRNVSRGHPVCERLWQLAGTVCDTLHRDCSVLMAPLDQLGTLINERDSAIQAAAEPYVPLFSLFQEKEAREQASWRAQRWLQRIEQQGAAPQILEFLRRYWVRVMEAASIKDGGAGSLWQEGDDTIAQLLWSVQPKQSPDDRKRLVRSVPTLLKQINVGLERIGISAEDPLYAAFLDDCYELQTAALRGDTSTPLVVLAALQEDAAPTTGITIESLEVDGKHLKTATLAGAPSTDDGHSESEVQTGNWLQFSMNDEEPLCGLVCRIIPNSGKVLLFNPDWGYAVALTSAVLKQQLRDARAKVVSSRAIFDIAAQSVMNQLVGT